ncbi:putative glycine-rich cell wall structural protein 1 [Ananas comosus]|uniref:Glycine-rich cell wall structural protein 1 n=1 Tax=Ananas comosus TaxID=4615 RepID=A0A6P5HNN1_ANACO|nr:putative glycine-rich cell wall structural protein 1 [Ananas comosus]
MGIVRGGEEAMRPREMPHPLCCIALDPCHRHHRCRRGRHSSSPDPATPEGEEVAGGGGAGAEVSVAGVLYKWTNYGRGWRSRWFSLRGGVLSYSKIRRRRGGGGGGAGDRRLRRRRAGVAAPIGDGGRGGGGDEAGVGGGEGAARVAEEGAEDRGDGGRGVRGEPPRGPAHGAGGQRDRRRQLLHGAEGERGAPLRKP